MKKIRFILSLIFCIAAVILRLCAPVHAADKKRVALLLSSAIDPYFQTQMSFESYITERGSDVEILEYNFEIQTPREISNAFDTKRPTAIFALGTKAATFARTKYSDIPMIFGMVIDQKPVMGPNVTGVLMQVPMSARLRMISRMVPNMQRVGMFYSPESASQYKEMAEACAEAGLKLYAKKIMMESDIPEALNEIARQIDCFVMTADSKIFFAQSIEHLLLEGLRDKFPIIGLSSFYTKAGTLASIECDYQQLGKQVGEIMMRILGGERPADMPVVAPRGMRLSLNTVVAKRLNINIPYEVRKEANDIFGEGE